MKPALLPPMLLRGRLAKRAEVEAPALFPGDTTWSRSGAGDSSWSRSGPGSGSWSRSGPGAVTMSRKTS